MFAYNIFRSLCHVYVSSLFMHPTQRLAVTYLINIDKVVSDEAV